MKILYNFFRAKERLCQDLMVPVIQTNLVPFESLSQNNKTYIHWKR